MEGLGCQVKGLGWNLLGSNGEPLMGFKSGRDYNLIFFSR